MDWLSRLNRLASAGRTLTVALLVVVVAPLPGRTSVAMAQELTDDMVGQSERAWQVWSAATAALDRDKVEDADKLLGELAGLKLSDLRLALMADRTGSLRLEQGVADKRLGDAATRLAKQIENGRRQRKLAEDGWHFAAIGRFKYADANLKALVDATPDPVALLELARYNPARTQTLIRLVANTDVGPAARLVLTILGEGEQLLRTDPAEIEVNIERLGGPPRVVYEATNRLKDSGEYAVPHLLAYLQDGRKRELHAAILQLLPMLGRNALNPMVMALRMKDDVTREVVARALGTIGYAQAAPYLAVLAGDPKTSSAARQAAGESLNAVNRSGTAEPGTLFRMLADAYYAGAESLQPDERSETGNVWYFDEADQVLRYVPVPRAVFTDIMAMRCAEEALKFNKTDAAAIALWIGANFRREGKLGMDVESEAPSSLAERDGTRPPDYPRSIYFARAAGPLYNHLALARAIQDKEPSVALGTIAALSATAGPASLVGQEDYKQALVRALEFPNRLVRVKAALALGRALPPSGFAGAQNVVPALAEALGQSNRRYAVIVDSDDQTRNRFQAVLRAMGFECYSDPGLYSALEQARKAGAPAVDAVVIASDTRAPEFAAAIDELRRRPETAAVPILVIRKKAQTSPIEDVVRRYPGVEQILPEVLALDAQDEIDRSLSQKLADAAGSLGMKPLDRQTSLSLALQAADVLRLIAVSRSGVFEVHRAEGALVAALEQPNELLRVRSAAALALVDTPSAQRALAEAALNEKNSKTLRIAVFGSLAESGRHFGGKLDARLVEDLVKVASDGQDLDIRTAASQALGAMNLTDNQASEIIRAQSRG